jgi:hypothetical protein
VRVGQWAGWYAKIQNFAPTGLCNTKEGQLHSKPARLLLKSEMRLRVACFVEDFLLIYLIIK